MKPLKTFPIRFWVASLSDPSKRAVLEGLVDTGASFPLVPEDMLRPLGIRPSGKKVFVLADGSRRRLPIARVEIGYGRGSAPCLAAVAAPGSRPLFGSLALESLGLLPDPVYRRLRPAKFYLLATP